MDIAGELAATLADDWLPIIYRDRIRNQRTRSISIAVPIPENSAHIQYTLLGIELKVGKMRFACPDLATARYMRVFARLGCREFAIPYDITKISTAADELETSWQRSLILLNERAAELSPRTISSHRAKLVKLIRTEIETIGPGERMPAFDRPTRRRD